MTTAARNLTNDAADEPKSESGPQIRRDPQEVERMQAWFADMPQPWKNVYEKMKRRRMNVR